VRSQLILSPISSSMLNIGFLTVSRIIISSYRNMLWVVSEMTSDKPQKWSNAREKDVVYLDIFMGSLCSPRVENIAITNVP
jgi:hypothetical protein